MTRKEFVEINPSIDKLLKIQPLDGNRSAIILTLAPENPTKQGFVDSHGKPYDYASRYFTPWAGIDEDPATGSSQCTLAPFWAQMLNKNGPFYAYQGYPTRGAEFYLELLPEKRVNITADDLGFNDVDWKDGRLYTPNLRKLAFHRNTVQLNNSYVNHLCTPTRASLMTGYYPFRSGTQNRVFLPLEERGVSLEFPFLPENLRRLGYKNYMIGKWHLGYCKKEYLPTSRGFDSFYGFYGAREGYFNHSAETKDPKTKKIISGLDLFNEVDGVSRPDFSKYGIYSTTLFANESIQVLKKHPKESPFFMYLAFQSVHVPLEVPFYYETFCEKLKNNRKRYVYCGMLAAMDEAIGQIIDYLKQLEMYENTVIIFTSDNFRTEVIPTLEHQITR
uniref:Sulfatase N-terminal domain-containing protein n=1 Tax=Acrobeloides nanus TaxID=290746 RepID=A0A914C115_9BILA